MKRAALAVLSACLGLGAITTGAFADDPPLKFRGAGKTREALDAMHFTPFDQGLWAHLSDWNGAAPKPADLTGKVVLIVTWSSWYSRTHGAMRNAQALHEQYKDKGLVVVGVHNPTKPEGAADNAKTLGITFPWALDKEGKFRAGLKADTQDPNVYFVDRSGAVRFAQLDASAMSDAAAHLMHETAEQAADYPKTLDKRRRESEADRWKTRDASGLRPWEAPTVTFTEPDEEAYTKTKWPYMVGKIETDPILEKIKNDPPTITNWPDEEWVPSAPKKLGKITVVYFIDPKEDQMMEVIPKMNRLQDKFARDVVVCGSLFKFGSGGIGNTGNQASGNDEEEKLKERNNKLIKGILATRSVNHPLNPTVLKADKLDGNDGGGQFLWSGRREELGIAAILSTDMKIRWFGNSHDPTLPVALDKLIALDPGVIARRKAEAAAGKGK